MTTLFDSLDRVERRIAAACERAGRPRASVDIVAVTKYATDEQTRAVLESDRVRFIGESRVQDAERKKAALGPGRARWRMIGHLQRNKAKQAVRTFDAVDSVDSPALGRELQKELEKAGRTLSVLVQVDLAGKESQHGAAPEELAALLRELKTLSRIEVKGLMTIAPLLDPVEAVRPYFRRLRELRDEHLGPGAALSMGMSRDFETAIEEGATLVRIGSSLFETVSTARSQGK